MQIISKKVSDLKPYDKNHRKHPQKQVDLLAENIRRFGFTTPVLISKDNEVIAGHGRLIALKQLGESDVPCVLMENLTDEEVKALRLADNQIALMGETDLGLAIEELKGLSDEMFALTGFGEDLLVDIDEDNFDAQAEYNKIVEPKTKLGDLWQLGEHRLLCGDSTQKASYGALFGTQGQHNGRLKADMVFTDPPYNVGYDYKVTYKLGKKISSKTVFNDSKKKEEFKDFIYLVFKNLFDYSKEGCCFYCWHAMQTSRMFQDGITNGGWHISQTIYWLKNQPTLSWLDYLWITEPCYFGWKGKNHFVNKKLKIDRKNIIQLEQIDFEELLDVIYSKRDSINSYIHPTQKPIRLAERALKKHSPEDGIVLEPFNGSGSTMMGCEQLKRKCYAIELDPKYVDVAIRRWELFTGNKATKI